ncbi:transposase family protein [Streptomyces sp. NPDC088553]|uniref:transposase family protein n=1 Tax=Streptomyces sp. NPDC088553 TaxID=3365864 RepID=UPI0037FCE5DC
MLLLIDRIATGAPYYSGNRKRRGMNIQALTDPFGRLLWALPALSGSARDLTAARAHGVVGTLAAADLKCWADRAHQGASRPARVPSRGRRLKRWQRWHNSAHAKVRCIGEQAMITLKGWLLLSKLRCSAARIIDIVKAVVTLHHTSS